MSNTPDFLITQLSDKLGALGTAINTFITSPDVIALAQNNAHQKLADLVNQLTKQDTYADSLQTIVSNFKPRDLAQLEATVALVRAYLQTTTFMDNLPAANKLGLKDAQAFNKLQDARKSLRETLNDVRADETDELAALVNESATLASQHPVDVGQLLNHLSEARKVLTRLRVDEIEQDDTQISQLIENWQAALKNLSKPIDAGSEHDRRTAISKTLALHELLDAIYGILSGDISAAAPLDLAIL